MNQITRRLEIDVGHRLLAHPGKCRNYHGHRLIVEVTCQAEGLDKVGRVVDFSVIKEKFGGWLDTYLDHGMVLQKGDPLAGWMLAKQIKPYYDAEYTFAEDPKVLVVPFAPTSENLAKFLFEEAVTVMKDTGVVVTHLRLYETPNCWSDYPVQR